MDGSSKGGAADQKPGSPDQNASPNVPPPAAEDAVAAPAAAAAGAGARRPFTSLTQEEADLALARVLQEQERAYMMLTAHGGDDYASSDYDDGDEDEWTEYDPDEDEHLHPDEEVGDAEGDQVNPDLDPAQYPDDEAYARALQDAQDREAAGRLMALAGIGDDGEMEQDDEHDEEDGNPQDAWEDVDPEEYSYEELIALGEVVGTESKGLSADTIASLPTVTYQAHDKQDGNMEQCVICCVEFEEGESLLALPCKHPYHSECINQWLQLNKICPMCSAEVSTSANNKA